MTKSRKFHHVGLLNMFLVYNIKELSVCLAMSDQVANRKHTHIQNVSFIPQLILKVQDIQESCSLIGREHLEQ